MRLTNRHKRINIRQLLRGAEIGTMQQVGVMQVIPLLSDLEHHDVAYPDELEVNTQTYGHLRFDNPSHDLAIIPAHAAYVVKQRAQDHAMTHAGIVKGKARQDFKSAVCIQQTQGGYISTGKLRMGILPFSIRESAWSKRNGTEYGRLWPEISAFNRRMGCSAQGHLEYFLETYKKELDQFVAEFELVPRQVGAIVLIDHQVVGIERAPNHAYMAKYWQPMIREGYGSLALEYQLQLKSRNALPKVKVPFPTGAKSLQALKRTLASVNRQEAEMAREVVRKLVEDPFQVKREDVQGSYALWTLDHRQFIGQMVVHEETPIYFSLIVKGTWAHAQARFEEAAEFSI
ncbi:ARPP-1 family domain-containing protein [Pontibacter sp. G13]|uniref:ARPP-1 family domain-containing protein n=1 Tax=Pontibacter sp. G13 TaxID=3074898 RepID=UPI00288A8A6F|nr:DUF6569 family protein [Pontibacter sp. G13]WNJ17320.1 DUF6569 family protein [Pontibacter sp. G13]